MSPVKTVYEPRFALQRGSSQFDEPQPDQTKDETGSLSQCRGGKRGNKRARGAGTVSGSVGGDVFFFSQRSNGKATNEKEKAKLAVLRTISKMLEENQLIRQRLIALRQVH
ncbi:uncharacterized protein AKAME5_001376000 [Lates japonicus]|uniref:Uncharacterized protein n=1 Tax=Lates japonicus TaxID=270547 RepID=A0AAD3MYU9_LATJO|nr:uncharacterized protein AKAME5_001376000 [Lates japonicus]